MYTSAKQLLYWCHLKGSTGTQPTQEEMSDFAALSSKEASDAITGLQETSSKL